MQRTVDYSDGCFSWGDDMIRYASLFSGIGGFELGIQQAAKTVGTNAECVFASEIDKHVRVVYENHFGSEYIHGNITKINAADIPDHDILCGGFPCQDVSIAGKREGLCGAKTGLFYEIIRILQVKKPRYVFLENVRGLLSSNGGWDFARIILALDEVGYDVEWQVLNTKNYLPQNRERVFIIGHLRTDGRCRQKIFPIRENDKATTQLQGQSTNTLTTRYEGGQTVGSYVVESEQHEEIPKIAKCLTRGGHSGGLHSDMTFVPVLTPTRQTARQCGRRFKTDGEPMFTLTSQDQHGVWDGKAIRRLTPIECERLQGFPDNWTGGISDTQRYKSLGNAVSVPVIATIAEWIIKIMNKEAKQ